MEQKNFMLAIILSMLILFGFQHFYQQPRMAEQAALEKQAAQRNVAPKNVASIDTVKNRKVLNRNTALQTTKRVEFDASKIHGSIRTKGLRFDDITLKGYRQSLEENAPPVELLSPANTAHPYFAEFGWLSSDKNVQIPTIDTIWRVSKPTKDSNGNIIITAKWRNKQGIAFTQTYTIDKNYMVEVTQTVNNNGTSPVTLNPYGLIARYNPESENASQLAHEGFLGVADDTLLERTFSDLTDHDEAQSIEAFQSSGAWSGFTDRYWMSVLIPPTAAPIKMRVAHQKPVNGKANQSGRFQTDVLGPAVTIAPGLTQQYTQHFYVGAKKVDIIEAYQEQLGINKFDLSIDFGWFYIITKPIFHVLLALYNWVGHFGIALILLTVIIRAALFPLAHKSFKSMARLKEINPKMKEIMKQHKQDRVKLNQELMALYKKEQVNPASGCLPIMLQMPIFFALYKVLNIAIEMRHAPFFGWIQDLSVPDPTSLFNLFGLLPYGVPDFLQIGVWPLLMGLTMFLQQRLNPKPTDPTQAQIFTLMPIIFTFILAHFPAGLVIYWTWSNLLSIAQQSLFLKKKA